VLEGLHTQEERYIGKGGKEASADDEPMPSNFTVAEAAAAAAEAAAKDVTTPS
jgi:hypothetical protein